MCKCEICGRSFTPRPQTKEARACDNRECQIRRQRLNEKEWKNKHKDKYGAEFYQDYRIKRFRIISELVNRIIEALRIGGTYLHEKFSLEEFKNIFTPFLSRLGIRCANKLWHD